MKYGFACVLRGIPDMIRRVEVGYADGSPKIDWLKLESS